jgi:hypothetical protein
VPRVGGGRHTKRVSLQFEKTAFCRMLTEWLHWRNGVPRVVDGIRLAGATAIRKDGILRKVDLRDFSNSTIASEMSGYQGSVAYVIQTGVTALRNHWLDKRARKANRRSSKRRNFAVSWLYLTHPHSVAQLSNLQGKQIQSSVCVGRRGGWLDRRDCLAKLGTPLSIAQGKQKWKG